MRSRFFEVSSVGSPIGRLPSRPVEDGNLVSGVLDVTQDQSDLAADFQAPPTRAISRGCALLGSQGQAMVGTYGCDRLFTWATDQPRHAAGTSTCPVEASSPPFTVWYSIDRLPERPQPAWRAFGAFPRDNGGRPSFLSCYACNKGTRIGSSPADSRKGKPPPARDLASTPSGKPRDGSPPGQHATNIIYTPLRGRHAVCDKTSPAAAQDITQICERRRTWKSF